MKPAPNTPGRRTMSEIAATLHAVMAVQAATLARMDALCALKLRPDHPLLPLLADSAQIEAEMPVGPECPDLGHGRAYADWRAALKRALARTGLPSRR